MASPVALSRVRAWVALLLGVLALLTLPVAVETARRSQEIALLDAGYAIPLAFLLSLIAVVMARRARDNLRWLSLRERGTAVASTAVIVGMVALCLAVTAALSIGFYELVLLYQHSR
jgi:glucose-6-phosphate-specific signal transduction histidine kinase